MSHFNLQRRYTSGLTLIELMIALALGLLLSAGALMMFIGNKETATLQEQYARVQENGRFATDILMREVRKAGYWGCASASTNFLNTLNNGTDDSSPYNFSRGVYGFEGKSGSTTSEVNTNDGDAKISVDGTKVEITKSGNTSELFDSSTVSLVANTDVLSVRTIDSSGCTVQENPGNPGGGGACTCGYDCTGIPSANIKVSADCPIYEKDILMVSDCTDAVVFQVTTCATESGTNKCKPGNTQLTITNNTGTGTPGNCTSMWRKSHEGSSIFRAAVYYFLVLQDANGTPSLYRWKNGDLEPLIEGVEDMQVLYGEDTGGGEPVDTYVTANAVADWDNVRSVRLDLLIRSFRDNVLQTKQVYLFDNDDDGVSETITSTDDRLRQVFSTTVAVRNKLL